MGFGGGGQSYDAPEVEPVPEKQPTKSVSAGATAAYEAQKDRQKKNRGLVSSIMTQRALASDDQSGKTTLG
ncbi:MAG: hypothetical protein HDQ93_06905 [Desulfovibrio sp.]|nr:hypothetical protein [Desulfovibrio sp.]